jgi:flagellar export protein FliJ
VAFRFRLEKVRKYRRLLVDRQAQAVAEANRSVANLNLRLRGIDEDLQRLVSAPDSCTDGQVLVQDLLVKTRWLEHLRRQRDDLLNQREQAGAELKKQRDLLSSVWRDLEVLDRLKERQRQQWLTEQGQQERRELDEIGQVRADRHRRSKVSP